jgi:hypothetical protein
MFNLRDLIVLGVIAAVAIWFIAEIALGGATSFTRTLQTIGDVTVRTLSNFTTLAWLAAGGATAIWLTIFTGFQPRAKGVTVQHR